jgi:hypothetical protein
LSTVSAYGFRRDKRGFGCRRSKVGETFEWITHFVPHGIWKGEGENEGQKQTEGRTTLIQSLAFKSSNPEGRATGLFFVCSEPFFVSFTRYLVRAKGGRSNAALQKGK